MKHALAKSAQTNLERFGTVVCWTSDLGSQSPGIAPVRELIADITLAGIGCI